VVEGAGRTCLPNQTQKVQPQKGSIITTSPDSSHFFCFDHGVLQCWRVRASYDIILFLRSSCQEKKEREKNTTLPLSLFVVRPVCFFIAGQPFFLVYLMPPDIRISSKARQVRHARVRMCFCRRRPPHRILPTTRHHTHSRTRTRRSAAGITRFSRDAHVRDCRGAPKTHGGYNLSRCNLCVPCFCTSLVCVFFPLTCVPRLTRDVRNCFIGLDYSLGAINV